jgi:hypothetical protein
VFIKEAFSKCFLDSERVLFNDSTLKLQMCYASIFWSSSKKLNEGRTLKGQVSRLLSSQVMGERLFDRLVQIIPKRVLNFRD